MNENQTKLILGYQRKKIPEFSIVIPTYKRPKYLKRTISSAVNQKKFNGNYEIIVINNDNSDCVENDEIREIVAGFLKNNASIYYYENNDNLGQYGNWSLGINLSKSNWIVMCHDDDVMSSYTLSCYHDAINNANYKNIGYIRANFIEGPIDELEDLNVLIDKKHRTNKLQKIGVYDFAVSGGHAATAPPTCGTLINKDAFCEVGGFKQDYFPCGDAEFIFDSIKKYNIYRTVDKFGVYGVGVNESLSPEMRRKFIEVGCKQLVELSSMKKRNFIFLNFFDRAIVFESHKIDASFRQNNFDLCTVSFKDLKTNTKLKIILYKLYKFFYFKINKIIVMIR